jgi:pullulanase
MQPLLANPALKPTPADITRTRDAFAALLRIRSSSDLFHMETLAEVQSNLSFLHTSQGVIAMRLNANGGQYHGYQQVLGVFNATMETVTVEDASLRGLVLKLHPELKDGDFDVDSGKANIPALTCAVFVA